MRWAGKGNAPCRIERVSIGPGGAIAAAVGYYQDNQIGARRIPRRAYETALLQAYTASGAPVFTKTFGASWHNEISDVLYRDDGRIVVLGNHGNSFSVDGVVFSKREVPVVKGQDMEFEANSGFAALFEGNGKVVGAADVDALVFGAPSASYARTCSARLDRGARPGVFLAEAIHENEDRASGLHLTRLVVARGDRARRASRR